MIRVDSAADVAETLGLLRTLARLTQSAVAEELGCNPSRVGHYEQGQRRQSVATLIRHLAAIGHQLAVVPLKPDAPCGPLNATESAEPPVPGALGCAGVDPEALRGPEAVGRGCGRTVNECRVCEGTCEPETPTRSADARFWGEHPAHPTCIDVTGTDQAPRSEWTCGPECPKEA